MNKKLLILGVFLIFFLRFYKTIFYKPLVGINTYIKTDIKKIDSITNSVEGQPLVLVVGTTKDGLKKGVWFDRRSFFNFKIAFRCDLDNLISKEEAMVIINENQLIHIVSFLQLSYFNFDNSKMKIIKGPYWYARGEDNEYTRYVYINPFTKKYISTENGDKIIKNTIY